MQVATQTHRFGRPLAQAGAAVILVHGRGSSGGEIARLADALDAAEVAFLAPTAAGGAWYPGRFFVPLEENEPWLSAALATLRGLEREIAEAGCPPARTALIGFSQGGCLALEHVARTGGRRGFVAALSGALIGPPGTTRAPVELAGTPVLLGCAAHDAHIPREHVEASAAILEKLGAAVTKQIFPGSAHTIYAEEIVWLNRQLAALQAAVG